MGEIGFQIIFMGLKNIRNWFTQLKKKFSALRYNFSFNLITFNFIT